MIDVCLCLLKRYLLVRVEEQPAVSDLVDVWWVWELVDDCVYGAGD